MSDNLPLHVVEKIIKGLPVKSLIQCRSVSKAWKSLIDSAEFIARHSTRHAHSYRLLVKYGIEPYDHISENCEEFVSFVDDDTFPQKKLEPTVPVSVELIRRSRIIGSSLGVLCLYGEPEDYDSFFGARSKKRIAIIWNPSIRKYVEIDVPNVLGGEAYNTVLGFGVCPDTSDVKIVKITTSNAPLRNEQSDFIPWKVEVYSLISGNWRSLSSGIPRKSIKVLWSHVAIDGLIYWFAYDRIAKDDGFFETRNLIMSFNMTTEEFVEVSLPNSLAFPYHETMTISKLRESLVVLSYDHSKTSQQQFCSVWEMKKGVLTTFTEIFTIKPGVESDWGVLGFSRCGKPVMLMSGDDFESFCVFSELAVYEAGSNKIRGVLYGQHHSFFVEPYVETLVLLHVPVEDEDYSSTMGGMEMR